MSAPGTDAPTAFVTGGSGFIGGRLIRRLLSDGWKVKALARSPASEEKVAARGAEPVRGDLDDIAAMQAGASGAEYTFHAAAHLGEWGSPEEFERGNVTGTRNALEASRVAGVRRFVHVGTEAALLAGQPLVNVERGRSAAAGLHPPSTRPPRRRPSRPCAAPTATASRRWSCDPGSSGARATPRSCPRSRLP